MSESGRPTRTELRILREIKKTIRQGGYVIWTDYSKRMIHKLLYTRNWLEIYWPGLIGSCVRLTTVGEAMLEEER